MEMPRTAKYVAKEKEMAENGEAQCWRRRMDQSVGTARIVTRTGCGVLGSCLLKE